MTLGWFSICLIHNPLYLKKSQGGKGGDSNSGRGRRRDSLCQRSDQENPTNSSGEVTLVGASGAYWSMKVQAGPKDECADRELIERPKNTISVAPLELPSSFAQTSVLLPFYHISPHIAILTSCPGLSPALTLTFSIFLTTSIPSATCPNTTCLPSK